MSNLASTGVAASAITSAVAAHRFGLGEPSLDVVGADPQAWLSSQIGPADAPQGSEQGRLVGRPGHQRNRRP